jgi:hypothetical protein
MVMAREIMNKHQREELLNQIEMFLGMGLLSLLVAALHWGENTKGGWGNTVDWIGRSISSLIIIIVLGFLLRKRKIVWFIVPVATIVLWMMFAAASIGWSYMVFVSIFVLFIVYSILLSAYWLWNNQTGKVSPLLDKIVNTAVYGRQMIWLALLLVGTITTWSEIRNHVPGFWPDIVLIICLLMILILYYGWVRGIWKDK